MSGTSMDGIDAALIRTDGVTGFEPVAQLSCGYDPAFRAMLRKAVGSVGSNADVSTELTIRHADMVNALLKASALSASDVRVVGFHGHTVFHDPANALTVQIGDGSLLASQTGIDVVGNFRTNDVACGGQGAPLVPLFHVVRAPLARPICFLNIGGVANLTWIDSAADPARPDVFDHVLAFDTGPGGAIIDDWVQRHTGQPFDLDGGIAAAGQVDEVVLAQLMDHPYFNVPPPKSLDRDTFDTSPVESLTVEDGAATLTAFSVAAVSNAIVHLPKRPVQWLVTGGGRKNATMMAWLGRSMHLDIVPTEAIGIDGDILEAQAFAYLAVRSLRGLPISGPTTTGVVEPVTGGQLFRAA
ncbi:MAG TPA: anhydro-N-acetylmuramic acid kinase [Rhodospirillaceae bacterium]|nr:anhydro-N-acetylmuramic acid kinase [Rhodospirillaceae bacterium]